MITALISLANLHICKQSGWSRTSVTIAGTCPSATHVIPNANVSCQEDSLTSVFSIFMFVERWMTAARYWLAEGIQMLHPCICYVRCLAQLCHSHSRFG